MNLQERDGCRIVSVPRWGVPPSGGGTHRARVLSCVCHMSLCMLRFISYNSNYTNKLGSPEGSASGKIRRSTPVAVIRFAETAISCMAVFLERKKR